MPLVFGFHAFTAPVVALNENALWRVRLPPVVVRTVLKVPTAYIVVPHWAILRTKLLVLVTDGMLPGVAETDGVATAEPTATTTMVAAAAATTSTLVCKRFMQFLPLWRSKTRTHAHRTLSLRHVSRNPSS